MQTLRNSGIRRLSCIALIVALHLHGILFYLVSAAMIVDTSAIPSFDDTQEYVVSVNTAEQDDTSKDFTETPAETPQPISEEERTESEKSDASNTVMVSVQPDHALMRGCAAHDTCAYALPYCAIFTPPPEVV